MNSPQILINKPTEPTVIPVGNTNPILQTSDQGPTLQQVPSLPEPTGRPLSSSLILPAEQLLSQLPPDVLILLLNHVAANQPPEPTPNQFLPEQSTLNNFYPEIPPQMYPITVCSQEN